jgi:hypothetical protein
MKQDIPQKNLAVLGCFRSGTNFAKTLLEQNFNCTIKNNVFGWKHGFVPIISNDSNAQCDFFYDEAFFITKNPFSFIVSLFNYHTQVLRNIIAPTDFNSFITSRIVMFDQSQEHSPQLRFSSPVELWNNMNWNYWSSHRFVHIRYEKLVEQPQIVCEKAASKIGIIRTSSNFFVPEKKVKRINDAESIVHKEDYLSQENFDSNLYKQHTYMENFDLPSRNFVLDMVDDELIDKLGYSEMMLQLYKQ